MRPRASSWPTCCGGRLPGRPGRDRRARADPGARRTRRLRRPVHGGGPAWPRRRLDRRRRIPLDESLEPDHPGERRAFRSNRSRRARAQRSCGARRAPVDVLAVFKGLIRRCQIGISAPSLLRADYVSPEAAEGRVSWPGPASRRRARAMIRVGIGGWTYEPWRGVFYPAGPAAGGRALLRQPQAHGDRDQRHLLRHAEAGELPQMGGRDAGRFRVLPQGPALRDEPLEPRRGRAVDRALLDQRADGARDEARTDPLAVRADKALRRGGFRRVPVASSARGRRAGPCGTWSRCATRASARRPSSSLLRSHRVAVVYADSEQHPAIADVTGDFVYARLQRSARGRPDRL